MDGDHTFLWAIAVFFVRFRTIAGLKDRAYHGCNFLAPPLGKERRRMDEEQIKALIATTISETLPTVLQDSLSEFGKGLSTQLLQAVDKKNSHANSSVIKDVKKLIAESMPPAETLEQEKPTETPETSSTQTQQTLSMKALQKQISDMQAQAQAKDREVFISDRRSALMGAIAGSGANPAAQRLLYDALDRRYGDSLKKEDGRWFLDKGDQAVVLDDALKEFLSTDEGKNFLPPSGVSGGGTRETQASEAARVENMSSGAMYMELLAG